MTFNRRNLLTSLAALPLAGSLFAGAAAAAAVQIDVQRLRDAADLLSPGVWMFGRNHPDLEFNLSIDSTGNSLLVTGYNRANRNYLGFAITGKSIKDRLHIASFYPSMTKLVECLSQPPLTFLPLDKTFSGWPGTIS